MIKNIFKDKILLMLIILSIINAFIMFAGGALIKLKFITLILYFLILIIAPKEKNLPVLFYIYCNSALYDDINFTYTFNFSIIIVLCKELFFYHSKINTKSVVILSILVVYDLIMIMLNQVFSNDILTNVSWIGSYLLLIIYSYQKKVDFKTLYEYFFVGFIFSCLCAVAIPINKWGFNIPTAYRFRGLLRDPNYYSIVAILLIFSSNTYAKLTNSNTFWYMIIAGALGILSISKMYMVLLILGICINILFGTKKIKIKQTIITIFLIIIAAGFIYNSNFLDLITKKYTYRLETTTLTTSRDKLQSYYLSYALNHPTTFLFGNSTRYAKALDVSGYLGNSFFHNMVAHNTYLDLFMSWGAFISLLYVYFIYYIFKSSYFVDNKEQNKNSDFKTLSIVILFGFLALSYFTADFMALMILYILLVKKNN